ncbi:MAG TPA: NAD-dependent epimerase/dehydratase family protein [Kiritimatiellia bacterium]|nr:NAD-dependent epimerase/dehydratase family protein [Kiritimatiellia bacterium]
MRILIVGCGYVGVRLAHRLMSDGHTVYGLRRNPPPDNSQINWISHDLNNPDYNAMPEADAMVLAAGLRRDTDDQYQRLFVDGYSRLLNFTVQNRPQVNRIVMISTTGVFAESNGGWVDEQSPVDHKRSPARFYLEAEQIVLNLPKSTSIVRLAGIYGPGRIRLIKEVAERMARLHPPPPHYLNHLHVDDAAGAIAHALLHSQPAPIYVASDPNPTDRNEVLSWIAHTLKMESIPAAAENTLPPPRRSGNKRCLPRKLLLEGYKFAFHSYRDGYAGLLPD